MRSKDISEPDSCLGVISLAMSAKIVAILQLCYSLLTLVMITTSDLSPLNNISSLPTLEVLKYSQQIFLHFTGITAAGVLGIGILIQPRRPDYLIVWLLLTSLQPLLFLIDLVSEAIRMDLTALALTMTSHGLQFILCLYMMHLMLSLHRQLSRQLEYNRLITASIKSYNGGRHEDCGVWSCDDDI